MYYSSEQEILLLVQQFNNKTLEKSAWTHAAHLLVGLWHVKNFSLDEAICRMRSGIIAYNISVGTENTGNSGYHETITILWLTILHHFIQLQENTSLLETCNEFLESPLASNTLPFYFYEKNLLLSPAARARFIEPDKKVSIELIKSILKSKTSIS